MSPVAPQPPPAIEHLVGDPLSDGMAARGTAYTDGALKGFVPLARRAGWAYVVVDNDIPIWGARGTCSEMCPMVLRSGLRAFLEILRVTVGPIVVYVDNASVVDGAAAGEKWCTRSKRDGADLWRDIWCMLNELPNLVEVKNVSLKS